MSQIFEGPIGRIHSKLRGITWPIDPYLLELRGKLHREPLPDFFDGTGPFETLITSEDIVLEAGANIGGLTCYLSSLAKGVHSFEPSPVAFEMLRKNVRSKKNVRIYNLGIADQKRQIEMNVEYSRTNASSIYRIDTARYVARIEAGFVSIDETGIRPDVIVLDCEGAEEDAIKGASKSLWKCRAVLVETHNLAGRGQTAPLVIHELQKYGFSIYTTFDRGRMLWVVGQRRDTRASRGKDPKA